MLRRVVLLLFYNNNIDSKLCREEIDSIVAFRPYVALRMRG